MAQVPASEGAVFDKSVWLHRLLGQDASAEWQNVVASHGAAAACCPVQWGENDLAFRCEDCQADSSCAVCPECFFDADHAGHSVKLIRTSCGCCDCGDASSWRPEGFCSRHRAVGEDEDSERALLSLPRGTGERCVPVLAEAVALADGFVAGIVARVEEMGDEEVVVPSATQAAAQLEECLVWLRSLGEASPGLRYALRVALTPRLRAWVQAAASCLTLRQSLYTFFVAVTQQSPKLKLALAVAFLEAYDHLLVSLKDRRRESLLSLTVQLFSIPEVGLALCQDHDAVPRLCGLVSDDVLRLVQQEAALAALKEATFGSRPRRSQQTQQQINDIRDMEKRIENLTQKVLMVCHDLEFMLHNQAAGQFVLQHQPSRKALLQLMSAQWRLNPQRREMRVHVLFEAEAWRRAFILEQELERTLQTLELTVRQAPWEQSSVWHGELLAELRLLEAEGAAGGSSFHLRLIRHLVLSLPLGSLSATLQGSGGQDQPPLAAWLSLFPAADLALMLKHAAGAYFLSSEVRAGLWVRNGEGMRTQAELYGTNNWQSQDLAVVQFTAILLGLHGSPGHEPAALLQGLGRERLGDDPKENAREASLETFWELVTRAAAEAWQLGVCAAHRGSPEYSGEAAKRALRRWLVHALASKALAASALREQLPWGWQDCPAVDEVVSEIATSKVGEGGALKFELREDSWRVFDCLLMVRGQRLPPEAEENAIKHKGDLLGPVRERGDCQVWRDVVLAAIDRPCLRAALRELVCLRGSARAESTVPSGTGALLWGLKMFDMLQALCRGRRELPSPGEVGVPPGAEAAGGAPASQEALEDVLGVLRELKEKETGTLGYVCSRVLARSRAPEPTHAGAQDREAQKAAKRRTLAARQRAVLQNMAARQQNFAAMAGGEDDMDVDDEPGESALYCDVCREASRPEDPVCLLAHSCRTTALERLAGHRDFAGPSLAVSACGHLVHASCVKKHREYFQSQEGRESLFHLSRPGPGSVLCPMCRTLSSCVLPVLPAGPSFQAPAQEPSAGGSRPSGAAGGSSPSGAAGSPWCAHASAASLPATLAALVPGRAAARTPPAEVPPAEIGEALVQAAVLQVLVASAASPTQVLQGGSPPLHAVLLRLRAALPPPRWRCEAGERDPRRNLAESGGRCGSPEELRALIGRLTQARVGQLQTAEADPLPALSAWLTFAAWVAAGLWTFEGRALNVLAHLPDGAAARATALLQMLGLPVDLLGPHQPARALASSPEDSSSGLVAFTPLPHHMLDLIKSLRRRPCARCAAVPVEPCICLICGTLVCWGSSERDAEGRRSRGCPALRGSPGVGSCGEHAQVCGAGQALLLAPLIGRVVAISDAGGPKPMCGLWDYPYVDVHGEVQPPTRTVSVTLDSRRLERLRTIFSTGTIGREILRHNMSTGRYIPNAL